MDSPDSDEADRIEAGDVLGKYVAKSEVRMVNDYCRTFNVGDGYVGSLSKKMGSSMALDRAIETALADAPFGFDSPRDRKMWVRQAVLDKLRAEREAAESE